MEHGECELEACVREVKEEVGLDLNDFESFAYLGKYPRNIPFFVLKDDRRMYVQPMIFVQTSFLTP